MLEVEVKLALADPAPARAALARLAAVAAGVEVQDDVFFAHPGRDFAATDEALRLRRTPSGLELTYKGPRLAGAAKARVEHNVDLGSDPTELLAALGFRPAARLAKRRESFVLNDGVVVALDHIEGLGWFLEVEATGQDRAAAEARVEAAVAQLGIAGRRTSVSYLELALKSGAASAQRIK